MPSEVPKTCKAARVKNPGPDYTIELDYEYPVPTPKRGQVLLKLDCTGICMSDHHGMLGDFGLPMQCNCSGHEGAGTVVALGEGVDGWKIGDRGGVKPMWDCCHECSYCREGLETHCDKVMPTGVVIDGSYAEYIVSPARYTTRIPEGVPNEIAAVLMCSGSTIYTALKNSQARAGQWVVIPGGGGGVGHQGLIFGKLLGLRMLAVDTGDDKRAMCLELGAEAFVDFKTSENVSAEVHKITGGGAQAVIVVGGTAGAYSSAPGLVRKGGRIVAVGLPTAGTATAGCDPLQMIFQKITVTGSLTSNMKDTDEALAFAARGLVKPKIQVRPFAEFKESLKMLSESKVAGRIVIDFNA